MFEQCLEDESSHRPGSRQRTDRTSEQETRTGAAADLR
jgi:hypothetical protein